MNANYGRVLQLRVYGESAVLAEVAGHLNALPGARHVSLAEAEADRGALVTADLRSDAADPALTMLEGSVSRRMIVVSVFLDQLDLLPDGFSLHDFSAAQTHVNTTTILVAFAAGVAGMLAV